MRRLVAVLASVSIFLATAAAFAQQGGTSTANQPGQRVLFFPHPMFHGGSVIVAFVILFALIGFFAVLGIVVRIAARPRWRRGQYGRGEWGHAMRGTALNILEERFARGEIDKAEFEDKRKLLSR